MASSGLGRTRRAVLPLIWSIYRRHRLSDADAEDVGQSVWLLLVQQLDRIDDQAALPGWLATVTRRECLRALQVTGGPLAAEYVQDAVFPGHCLFLRPPASSPGCC
jgi:DNA-directed RNA polymerase specialized sigma24 family protein